MRSIYLNNHLSTSGKIRVMLVLLCASLLFTAVVVQKTYTPVNNLDQTAKKLENNLRKKEGYVNDVLNNKSSFDQLKKLPDNTKSALKFIQNFTTDKGIWFITLRNDRLSFWSGVKIIPEHPGFIKRRLYFNKGTKRVL